MCLSAHFVVLVAVQEPSWYEDETAYSYVVLTVAEADCHSSADAVVHLVTVVIVQAGTAASFTHVAGQNNGALEIGENLSLVLRNPGIHQIHFI